jgi:DNA-binding CsgD family transcriptional regulator
MKGSDMVKKKSAKKGRSPARSKTAKTGRRKRAAGRAAGAKHRRRPAKGVRARRPKQAPPIHLTPREEEEAAAILELSPSTVDNHKTRLMAKLGTDKTALLTRLALKMGATTMRDKLTAAEKRRSGRKRDGWN